MGGNRTLRRRPLVRRQTLHRPSNLGFPGEPSAKGFLVGVNYSIYRGDTLLGAFHETRGFQPGNRFFEMTDLWQPRRTSRKSAIENIQIVPAAGEYRIVATLVSDIDGFVYGSKTINAVAK